MKKFSIDSFEFIAVLLTLPVLGFLVQACGGGGNNASPFQTAPGAAAQCVGANCTGAPVNAGSNPLALENVQLTGNKQLQYARFCSGANEFSQHFVLNGVNVCRFEMSGQMSETIDERAILTPNSTMGGLATGIQLYSGDTLEMSAQGHYSHRKPSVWKEASSMGYSDGCHNEYNIDGSMQASDDDEPQVVNNTENGQPAGLYVAVSANGRSFVSAPTPMNSVGSASKGENKTQTVIANASVDVVVGYNTDRIECGDLKLKYKITRCLDANLNTYPCPKE